MRLDQLLAGVDVVEVRGEPAAVDIIAITHDSRTVAPGTLFCCVPGTHTDGHQFAGQAVAAGAPALIVEHLVDVAAGVCQVVVADARTGIGQAAASLHGWPSRDLIVAGVTGTNGKTTSTILLQSIFRASGLEAEVIGTLNAPTGGPPSTPDAPVLQAQLAAFRDAGVGAVAIEVSSHALDQRRVAGTEFAVAVFTNLTQDHLDYHGDLESYFEAKARLFEADRSRSAAINIDDAYGQRLLERSDVERVEPYSIRDAEELRADFSGSHFVWRETAMAIHLPGRFNVANAIGAATAASLVGIEPDAIAVGLDQVASIPGRVERLDQGQPFAVIIDYAHSPDGLEQLLGVARVLAGEHRVIALFGCGGDKDRGKRPLMGAVVDRLADVAVVTSDNPRSEDPETIIKAILGGMQGRAELVVEADRRAAIAAAVAAARPGDVVVVAGKGHETGQEIGDTIVPFDDRDVTRDALVATGWGGAA
ncbi:MAG: UDP-N-acetylmuramoyl-L-alanyl-D-glutamate--2,6-diaminopimelate ligase [Actinomycetota bacterium]|jgi:UDP-N-acetylmuramoyl-L-alanyl-D-glutamate--2,6-diaminopimelate ligase|nr:UDP-N-acetylmuramoyl-L-alanyl-D-glutamate--2,6-diaminopimelate ligase [Actinomycetota bacterium]